MLKAAVELLKPQAREYRAEASVNEDAEAGSGFTKIGHDLLEALIGCDMPASEVRLVLLIIRLTNGWHRDSAPIPLAKISDNLGIAHESHCSRLLASLKKKGVVMKVRRNIQLTSVECWHGVKFKGELVPVTGKRGGEMGAKLTNLGKSDNVSELPKVGKETYQKPQVLLTKGGNPLNINKENREIYSRGGGANTPGTSELFSMHIHWQPRPEFSSRCVLSGINLDKVPAANRQAVFGEFVSFWETRPDEFNQGQWEHRLLQRLIDKNNRGELFATTTVWTGKSAYPDRPRSAVDRVNAAISERSREREAGMAGESTRSRSIHDDLTDHSWA